MDHSRRDLSLLLPVLLADAAPAETVPMASAVYRFEDLPVKANGENRSRAVLNGTARNGYRIEAHHSELAPGLAPHPSHHHVHEEMLVLREGTLEVTIS